MPSLRNMVGETGFIEIPVSNDEPLIVFYKRGKRSPREQIKILKAQRELAALSDGTTPHPDMIVLMVEMLADMVVSWNLHVDGVPVQTDAESLLDVDLSILTEVMTEIGRQSSADPLSRSGSSNGSVPKADLEPLQIGIPSS